VKKNPIKILKKLAGMVQFRFYKPEIKKKRTELKTKKNRAKPEKTEPNRVNRKNRVIPV